jgi:glycosyltransferase involved in cell wall biosynthesis
MKMTYGAPPASKTTWTINGRFTTQRITGVQRYAHEIINEMDRILSENRELGKRLGFELVIPPDGSDQPTLAQIAIHRTRFGSGHLWEQFLLPWYLKSGVLSLGNLGPALARCPLVCIHDVNTFTQPESYSPAFRTAYRTLQPLIGRLARKVATVSQFSADMLVQYGLCQPEKIFIAPNGHEHILKWDSARAKLPLLKQLKRPYVLLLGSKAKHKNIKVVLEGAEALDAAGIDLVVVGADAGIFSDMVEVKRANVHYTGYVRDDDLAALYEGAICLTFPSLMEGFGIPPLEAMAKGCPVICSNAASLNEVGGDAVVYVDPDRAEDWRDAAIRIASDPDFGASLAEKGRKRAELFSWKRSAQRYLDEILKLS